MRTRDAVALIAVLAALAGPCFGASLTPRPPPSTDATQAAFDEGFSAGYGSGSRDANASCEMTISSCQNDPASCGISLGACLAAPIFGETEPNDNIVTADPLLLDTKFWAQSYAIEDQDWFYVITTRPNQTLTVNFSRIDGPPQGWILSVRDAAGNLIASFNTGSVQGATSDRGDITYRVTLGLVGTYYIEVVPDPLQFTFEPYQLAALLQDAPLATENFVASVADAEIEPNDDPSQSTVLTTGVTMYGLISLVFPPQATLVPDPDGDGFEFVQGETDWFIFPSQGNEIVTLSVCNRGGCGDGQWLFQIFDEPAAFQNWSGAPGAAPPLLAFNSEVGNPGEQRLGISQAGNYYIRVQHRRLLTAQCVGYGLDINADGQAGDRSCTCEPGASLCQTEVALGSAEVIVTTITETDPETGTETTTTNYICPNGSLGEFLGDDAGGDIVVRCSVDCRCNATDGQITLPGEALTSPYNFTYFSTELPPSTANGDAFDDFQNRPSPF